MNQHQIGYAHLDEEDRAAIREFSLLWSVFELQALLGDGSVEAMIGYSDELAKLAEQEGHGLLVAPFIPHLTYFRRQFVDDRRSSTNELFDQINFARSEHRQLVSRALITLRDETPELVKALLIIVHRLRDSLFRGLKWQRCSKKQRDDLYHASKILMKATDLARV
ncbi:MAG: hypothetical protein R3F54_20750 [Alphaproteobacteria bacterium]